MCDHKTNRLLLQNSLYSSVCVPNMLLKLQNKLRHIVTFPTCSHLTCICRTRQQIFLLPQQIKRPFYQSVSHKHYEHQ